MQVRLLYIITFLLFSIGLYSQGKQYVFTRISVKDGLASDHVYSIAQDKKGFMWFGTADGLQRYDGKKIISFLPGPSDSLILPNERIYQVMIDKRERFWIRVGKEAGLLNPATFAYTKIAIDVPRQELERSDLQLIEDTEGNIFLLVSRFGILVYNEKKRAFVQDKSVIDAPRNVILVGMQQDPLNGNYWIGSHQGLSLFHRQHRKLYTHAYNPLKHPVLANKTINQSVTTFFIDKQLRMWVGNWLFPQNTELFSYFDMKRNKLVSPIRLSLMRDQYHELHTFRQQRNGKLWAHGLGVLAEGNESATQFNQLYNANPDDFGIKYDAVHCFIEDREQNVWLGTNQGIYVFNPESQKFTSIGLAERRLQGLATERSHTSFLQLNSGDILAGSWGQGISTYDSAFGPKNIKIYSNAPSDPNYYMVWSMFQHSSTKKVWMGCQAGRLMVYDPQTSKTIYLNHPAFEARTIRSMAEDKHGNLWFGTQHGRLVKWNAEKGSRSIGAGFELAHTFGSNIYKIKQDVNGYLWIGSQMDGISVIDAEGNLITQYNDRGSPGRSLAGNMITDILFYDDSLVMICTNVLNILNKNTGSIRQISNKDGLPSNTVNCIQKDDEGNLWIGVLDGLCRYNMKKKIFTLFSQKDGIIKNEFANGNSYRLRDGRLVFGNPHDFVYFNPQQILPSSAPPDVSITDFKLFNSYLPPDSILQLDKVILPHDQNSITIEFAALSFLQKDKMVYYTKMEGIDEHWNRVDKYNVSNFALLPPGDYTFRVKCENGDGIPSKHVTSLRIYIRPPFWRQEWFIILCILIVAGLIYLAHRMRIQRLMEMEKVRGRIARDLHDDMGSTLSTINILSEMAKMKVGKDTDKTSEYISKISDNSNRMMEAMDDIVWSINPMNDSMQRITARMREFATGVLEAKDIEVVFKVDEKVKELRLDMESRRDFFLIFKEAVNNIAKYSGCRHTIIEIAVQGPKLIMQIQDDGAGFDVQQADSGNGLSNMRKRAESLRGQLVIDSVPGVGTRVRLEAPLT